MSRKFTTKLIFFLTIILSFSCKGEQDKIPNVYVNISLDLNKPDYSTLSGIGNYVYITGGVSGIVVYRDGQNDFVAFDRACPHDPECGRVFVNKDISRLIDTICCQSEFTISANGAPVAGPAKNYLKKYQTFYNQNTNTLLITN